MDARLIVDPPARGSWNMAVDEALFEAAQESRHATLRFYQWSEPTLTLGYFQSASQRETHVASRLAPLIRRATGGGAILHDDDLTYSLLMPIQDDHSAASQTVVRLVHEALIEALGAFGVAAQLCGASSRCAEPNETVFAVDETRNHDPARDGRPFSDPFLCFQRRAADDVVMGADKIAGSAQRRLRDTLLQHGSVLCGRSMSAPELPGIADLTEAKIPRNALRDRWLAGVSARFGWDCVVSELTPRERHRAEEFERQRFWNDRWNQKR